MAADEWLVSAASERRTPFVRFYRWTNPAISFGYFQPWARMAEPGVTAVRRATGGGRVEHGADFTFSVACPVGLWLAELDATQGYEVVNRLVCGVLQEAGVACHLHPDDLSANADRAGLACFVSPARHDVVSAAGSKLCGGAQRRSAKGLSYQGSIALSRLPQVPRATLAAALRSAFGQLFGTTPAEFVPDPAAAAAIAALAGAKYSTERWNRRR